MLTLSVKTRQIIGKKVKVLRKNGLLPAVIYGPKIKPISLALGVKEFEKTYQEAGESSLIKLELPELKKEYLVLIHEVQRDPLTDKFIHVDFYQAPLGEEIEAKVPLVFEGEAPAIKELGGTLIKNISELEVKALPQNLPKEIKINVESLITFEDTISIKGLKVPSGVKILKDPNEIVAQVTPPEKVEEELEKPIEEKVEEVEKVEEEKKKEETENEK